MADTGLYQARSGIEGRDEPMPASRNIETIVQDRYQSALDFADAVRSDIVSFPYDRLFLAVVVFLVFFLLRKPFRHLLFVVAGKFFIGNTHAFRESLYQVLRGPVELFSAVIGTYFAFEIMRNGEDGFIARVSEQVVGTLFIVLAYWAMFAIIGPVTERIRPGAGRLSDSGIDWLRKATRALIAFFAVAAVLQQWGVRIGPMLAGMGIAGAAVALGAQVLFKNLISGVLILIERRVQYGDWIKVQGVIEGTVESIGFRSTRIRQFDDSAVQVPNADLADNAVINYTQMRRRRIFWLIGVPYSTTIEQLRQIQHEIEAYIQGNAAFVDKDTASTFVRIDSFGASAINIMVYCYTTTTRWGEWLQVKEDLAYRIMEIVLGAGSSFAFPSTSVYVETLPGEKPDIFVPPDAAAKPTAAG